MSVDLPVPFGPTSAMRSPRSTCRVAERNTTLSPYALRACFSSKTIRPLFAAVGKREVHALALGRHLDGDDLLEHLDPALHLRGLRRLVAEPVDEHLDPLDFLVLLLLGLAHPLQPRLALLEVVAVVAGVVGQLPEVHLGDPRDDRVEEVAVVRDEDDGVRVVVEVLLEPVARLEVEVVGRLVEQQQVGAREQQLGERDAHLPAARERLGRAVEVVRREAEAVEDRRQLQVDAVAVVEPEAILQVAVAGEHRLVLGVGDVRVAEAILELVHLGLDREQRLEGEDRLLVERAAPVNEAVLREVADGQARRLDDAAARRPRRGRRGSSAAWSCPSRSGRTGRRARRRRSAR